MASLAFVSSFVRGATTQFHGEKAVSSRRERRKYQASNNNQLRMINDSASNTAHSLRTREHRHVIGIVGKSKTASENSVEVDASSQGNIFGVRANAYWESMGVLPLFFAGFGILALAIKMVKVKGGELRSGPSGVNKVTIPKTAITTEEEEAELHVFKCGGCGYEIYPARGREFKFFPDSFKCPLCGTPKSEFWDLNDPDDPRNQEPEGGPDDPDTGGQKRSDGKTVVKMDGQGKDEASTKRPDQDPSA